MPKIDVWMPWYIADYQSDTAHLNPPQDSAYRRLLEHQWKTRRPLPNDVMALIQITKMSPFFVDASSIPHATRKQALSIGRASASKEERELYAWILDLLQQFFSQNEDGTWSQLRLEKELKAWGDRSEIATEKAKKAAWDRWHGPNSNDPKPRPEEKKFTPKRVDAPSITPDMPKQSPSPSPRSTKAKYQRNLTVAVRRSGKAPAQPKRPASTKPPNRSQPKTPSKTAATPRDGARPTKPRPNASTVPIKSVAPRTTNGLHPPKSRPGADPRFGPFQAEIFRYWHSIHSKGISDGLVPRDPPWGPRERAELSRWLVLHPDADLRMLQHLLVNRAYSERVNHSSPPYLWIKDLTSYAMGALNKYKQAARPNGR